MADFLDWRDVIALLRNVDITKLSRLLDEKQLTAADPTVGIHIMPLTFEPVIFARGQTYRFYAARVEPGKWVKPHYHHRGTEPYVIYHGVGEMNVRHAREDDWPTRQNLLNPYGRDWFIVPEDCVHTMRNIGEGNLDFGFSCPEGHLSDEDRFMVPDLPPHFPR